MCALRITEHETKNEARTKRENRYTDAGTMTPQTEAQQMPYLTNADIEERKAAGTKLNKLDCGWNLPNEVIARVATMLNEWEPKTPAAERDKKIVYLAFIKNMNASAIKRLNDPLLVGMGNRSRGKPLSVSSILHICYKYVPEAAQREQHNTRTRKQRNSLFREQTQGDIAKLRICATCGSKKETELPHIIPIEAGGTNDYYNLVYLCHACRMKLHHRLYDHLQFLKKITLNSLIRICLVLLAHIAQEVQADI